MRLDEFWQQGGLGGGRGAAPRGAAAAAAVDPSHQLVEILTDMGFPRQRVEEALRAANNDLDQATNLLLREV